MEILPSYFHDKPVVFSDNSYAIQVLEYMGHYVLVKNGYILAKIREATLHKYYNGDFIELYKKVRNKDLEYNSRREMDIKKLQDEIDIVNTLYYFDPDNKDKTNGTSEGRSPPGEYS